MLLYLLFECDKLTHVLKVLNKAKENRITTTTTTTTTITISQGEVNRMVISFSFKIVKIFMCGKLRYHKFQQINILTKKYRCQDMTVNCLLRDDILTKNQHFQEMQVGVKHVQKSDLLRVNNSKVRN